MPIHQRYALDDVDGVRVGRFKGGINTSFIVYRLGEALIDAGPANQWPAVRAFVDERPVGKLLLTHHHEDHGGNADRIARYCGLTPFAPALSQAKLRLGYPTPLTQKLIWGSPRPVETQTLPEMTELDDGTRLQAIHTPGHAKDLHVFFLPDRGAVFSGDLYISKSLRYLRSDERLDQLVDSIRKVLALDFTTLFCPHRGILEDGGQTGQYPHPVRPGPGSAPARLSDGADRQGAAGTGGFDGPHDQIQLFQDKPGIGGT